MDKKKKKQKGVDFYGLLQVSPEASQDQIKSKYRRLALKWHPDKNGNSAESTERFKLISEAYSVLSDPDRRRHYDKYGTVGDDEESTVCRRPGHVDLTEKDLKHMRKMYRDLAKGARIPSSRKGRKKQADLDDMLSSFMMPSSSMPPKNSKKKANNDE